MLEKRQLTGNCLATNPSDKKKPLCFLYWYEWHGRNKWRKKRHTTASGEDYLEAILVLKKKLGMVRSVDVARQMGVSKPSVCVAGNTLKDGGFLTMDENHFLHLTDVGREVAEKIYERHCFFTQQLIAAGVDPRTAEADACRIEHIISDESFSRLKEAAETRPRINRINRAILPR